jgi:hypothetical protein
MPPPSDTANAVRVAIRAQLSVHLSVGSPTTLQDIGAVPLVSLPPPPPDTANAVPVLLGKHLSTHLSVSARTKTLTTTHSPLFQISGATPSITITIKTLYRYAYRLGTAFYPSDTIWRVKEVIHETEGIPCDKQNLYFKGVPLENGRTLAHYDITTGCTIDLGTCILHNFCFARCSQRSLGL